MGKTPPVHVHLADNQQLALSRKPRKHPVSSLEEWTKRFTVYANTPCAHQPARGPDMLGYLFIIASSLKEFSLPMVLAYDIAFRHKAALLKLSAWGHIDPLLYSRAFTGPGKARTNSHVHALPRRRPLGFRVRFIFRRASQESQGHSGWSEAARPIPAGDMH